MKALWIRVEAHEVDSRHISRFAVALGVKKVHALGHYAALGGAIAEHTDDGRIDDVDTATLEEWGRWDGKPGKLAAAVRETLQGPDGTFSDWLDSMGKLVDRRARDRERKEQEKARREAERAGRNSTEIPRNGRGNSTENGGGFHGKPSDFRGNSTENASFSAATERNGTERDGTVKADSGKREDENSTASASLRSEPEPTGPLPTGCQAFLNRFYPVTGRRRTDVERQLLKLAAGHAVKDGKKQEVRAYTGDRLEEKCLEVISENTVRDLDKAIVVLFTKLGDTSDGSAPGQREAEQRTRPDDESLAIDSWMRAHPKDVDEIRTDLAGGGPVNAFAAASIDAQIRARVRQRLFAHPS